MIMSATVKEKEYVRSTVFVQPFYGLTAMRLSPKITHCNISFAFFSAISVILLDRNLGHVFFLLMGLMS